MTPFGARMVWVPFTGGQQNMGEIARQLLVERTGVARQSRACRVVQDSHLMCNFVATTYVAAK